MPAPFSGDLRLRVIWFVHVLQHSVAETSFFLGVSEITVERYISKFEKSVSFFCLRSQEPSEKRS